MMKNANSLLMDLEEQMNMIGLPLMALKLDELYRSSDFLPWIGWRWYHHF